MFLKDKTFHNSLVYRFEDYVLRHNGAREMHGSTGMEAENMFRGAAGSDTQIPTVPRRYLDRHCIWSESEICGQPCFRILPKRNCSGKAILYLFGGGFLKSASKRDFICAAELANRTGREVWLYCYPLEPVHTIHDIVEATAEVYRQMLEKYPSDKIAFFGLSAGACVSLYFLNYVRHEKIGLPYPERLILNSPVVELPPTESEYRIMQELDPLDAVLPVSYFGPEGLISCMLRREPEESLYLSQVLEADMTGWPQVTLIYGTNEVAYAYARDLIRACRAAGVPVSGAAVRGGGHCTIHYRPSPEARQVMRYVCEILSH